MLLQILVDNVWLAIDHIYNHFAIYYSLLSELEVCHHINLHFVCLQNIDQQQTSSILEL